MDQGLSVEQKRVFQWLRVKSCGGTDLTALPSTQNRSPENNSHYLKEILNTGKTYRPTFAFKVSVESDTSACADAEAV